eukprot:gene22271-30513_t
MLEIYEKKISEKVRRYVDSASDSASPSGQFGVGKADGHHDGSSQHPILQCYRYRCFSPPPIRTNSLFFLVNKEGRNLNHIHCTRILILCHYEQH